MKKIFLLLLLAAASVAVSCTEISPTTYDKGITLSTTSMSFIGDGESQVIKITTTGPWKLDLGECTWLSASKTSGEATEKIILTSEKNPSSTDSRTATVSFRSGEHIQYIEVTQERFMMWVRLDRNGETYQCDPLKATETIPLQVTSNTSWTISAPEWVALSQKSGENNATVTLTVDNSNVTEEHRSGTVRISCGEQEQTFNINQVCSFSNTFVIKSTGTYSIPAARPDGTQLDGAASADWLYMSKDGFISNVSYADGRIGFSLDSMGGYAVIALMDGTGTVIWSYTIWATEELEDVQIGTDVWMDRNIGAWTNNLPVDNFGGLSDYSAYGCYYQWGRKDSFPGPRNSAIDKATGNREARGENDYYNWTASIEYVFNQAFSADGFQKTEQVDITPEYTIAHPWLFFHKDYAAAGQENLWSDTRKTIYDPCPAGYRVPTKQQMDNMISTLDGWTKTQPFSNSYSRVYTSSDGIEFSVPSTAYREWGSLTSTGRMAGYWTTTLAATNYSYMNLDFSTADGQKHNRGFAVRCVKIQ